MIRVAGGYTISARFNGLGEAPVQDLREMFADGVTTKRLVGSYATIEEAAAVAEKLEAERKAARVAK